MPWPVSGFWSLTAGGRLLTSLPSLVHHVPGLQIWHPVQNPHCSAIRLSDRVIECVCQVLVFICKAGAFWAFLEQLGYFVLLRQSDALTRFPEGLIHILFFVCVCVYLGLPLAHVKNYISYHYYLLLQDDFKKILSQNWLVCSDVCLHREVPLGFVSSTSEPFRFLEQWRQCLELICLSSYVFLSSKHSLNLFLPY